MNTTKNLMRLRDSTIYYYRKRIPSSVRKYFESDYLTISTRIDSLIIARRIEKEISHLLADSVKYIQKDSTNASSYVKALYTNTKLIVKKFSFPELEIEFQQLSTRKKNFGKTQLSSAIANFIEERKKKKGIALSSENRLYTQLNVISSLLGINYCEEITESVLNKYITTARAKYKDSTLFNQIITLKSFLKYLEKNNIITYLHQYDDIFSIKLSKQNSKAEFNLKQLQTIFNEEYSSFMKRPYYYFIPLISLVTGMRISEVVNLKTEDVHFTSNYFYFIIRKSKTYSGIRTVSVPNSIKFFEDFKSYYDSVVSDQNEKLFSCTPQSIDRKFRLLLTKHKLNTSTDIFGTEFNHSFHSLRHSYNVKLESMLVPDSLKDVLLGHAPKSTLATYSKKEDRTEEIFQSVTSRLDFDAELKYLKPLQK